MKNFCRKVRLKLDNYGILRINDEKYIQMKYHMFFGRNANLENPKTFNEKLQWLKLHDHNPEYVKMVDKYEAKKYVAGIIGEKYIIPTIGVYEKFDDINFDDLPNQFVIKCTHDSGGVFIIKNKNEMDKRAIKKKINKHLKRNYYYTGREWPYKNVAPRIIVEKYINDEGSEIKDYKFFCFNGDPKIILVCSERFSSNNMCKTWFDAEWRLLPIIENGHRVDKSIRRPHNFDLMKAKASVLSKGIPFVRVDFYEVHGKVYFGEMTFFPASGYEKFSPEKWDRKFGEYINIDKIVRERGIHD